MLFHNISYGLLKWMRKQEHVKEESLTDRLLYDISEATNRFVFNAFSRNEESFNGTDWEWWVLTAEPTLKAYRFLIQAKKLKADGKDKYAQMCYGNRNGMQIDLLINSAKELRAMPLYMFYSSEEGSNEMYRKLDRDIQKIVERCNSCENGAFIASACLLKEHIFSHQRRYISSEYLLSRSIKLSLLDQLLIDIDNYNNKRSSKDKTPDEYMRTISKLYREQQYACKSVSDDDIDYEIMHTSKDIPYYVFDFIKKNQTNQTIYYQHESDFSRQTSGLSGSAVLDLRPEIFRHN